MRPILVTGAQGFVGRSFVVSALSAGERVVGLGRSPRSDTHFTHAISIGSRSIRAPLPDAIQAALTSDAYEYVESNLLDPEKLRRIVRETQPRAVVHLATALRDDPPRRLVEANIAATVSLIDAVRAQRPDIECIVLGSSAAVYGRPRALPVTEAAAFAPIEPYGATKCAAEQLSAMASRDLPARIAFARIFNVVGAGQDERHVCGRFAAQAVSAYAPGTPLHVGDLSPTRDFIDVRDVAAALLILMRSENASGAYNVCSGKETPIGDVLAMTLRSADLPEDIGVESSYHRNADASRSVGDNSKLRALGWAPQLSLERSVADVVAYYRSITAETGAEFTRTRAISGASPG
jgi:GDP-4-dehydro-6-deoxy-D-mannose reductase